MTGSQNLTENIDIFSDRIELVDCEHGLDIERDDRLLATVIKRFEAVDFVVWHDRFPTDSWQETRFI